MDNQQLRYALVKVAARNRMQRSFAEELVAIDPYMEKVAWQWARRVGRKAWGGIKSVGNYIKDNPLDAALTATMFIPGLNVAGGLVRGGVLAARAANAGRKAYMAGRTIKGISTAQKAGTGAYKGLTYAQRGAKGMLERQSLGRAQQAAQTARAGFSNRARSAVSGSMPWNRSLGGMSFKSSPWKSLGGWGKAGRVGMTGAGAASMYYGGKMAKNSYNAWKAGPQSQNTMGPSRGGSYLTTLSKSR